MGIRSNRVGLVTAITLALAGLGIVSPILWDRYRTTASVELLLDGVSVVVSPLQGVDKPQLTYGGRRVSSVSKVDLTLVNSGRTPVRAADIVTPPWVKLGGGDILDARIQRVFPDGVAATLATDTVAHTVSVGFPLLNPGDAITYSILVSSDQPALTAGGRIAGVSGVAFRDERTPGSEERARLTWFDYSQGAMAIAFLVLSLATVNLAGQETAIASLWKRGVIADPTRGNARETLAFIAAGFSAEKSEELKELTTYLKGLPPDHELTADERVLVRDQLGRGLTNISPVRRTMWLILIITGITTGYVVSRFV